MNSQELLKQLLGHPGVTGLAGGVLGGLLTSKSGRKLGKTALKLGGAAATAGLAYAAWRRHQVSQPQRVDALRPCAPEPSVEQLVADRFLPEPGSEDAAEPLARVLLMAMLAAARADGRVDAREHQAIRDRLGQLELDPVTAQALAAQLDGPVDVEALVRAAKTPELAAEIYAASLLVIDLDTASERGHLMLLADRLGLPDSRVHEIHREVEAPAAEPLAVGGPVAS